MAKVVINGKIVEKSKQGIQKLILAANPHLLNKFELPKSKIGVIMRNALLST